MRKKLRSARGETLVELLCAVLIGALSVFLLFSTVMVSIRMDRSAKAADERLAADFRNAERRETGDSVSLPGAKVTVRNTADPDVDLYKAKPSVTFYGGSGAISYELNKEAP